MGYKLMALFRTVGPIVSSEHARSAELHVSLLERLFERPVYANCQPKGPQLYPDGVDGYASPFSPLTNLVRVCRPLVFFVSAFAHLVPELSKSSCYTYAALRHIL